MADHSKPTPSHEPEVAEAIAYPDQRVRRLAAIARDGERARENLKAAIPDPHGEERR